MRPPRPARDNSDEPRPRETNVKIILDKVRCDGLGMCEAAAPDIFEVGEDGIVVVLDESPDEDRRDEVAQAIESCPVLALRLES